jgi:glyoxylase-like metal-dependent hydrolase (beta-lactamase superfamily II)
MSTQVIPIPLGPMLGRWVAAPFVNAYLVRCGDGWIVVDTGLPGCGPVIHAAIERNGIQPLNVRWILLTHGHFDHYGGALELAAALGSHVQIAMHPDDRPFITGERVPDNLRPTRTLGAVPLLIGSQLMRRAVTSGRLTPWSPEELARVHWLGEVTEEAGLVDLRERLAIPIQAVLTPGHSPGSLSFRLPGGEMLVGDILSHAVSGAPAPPLLADEPHRVLPSLQRIAVQKPCVIFPGHGALVKGEALAGLLRRMTPAERSG